MSTATPAQLVGALTAAVLAVSSAALFILLAEPLDSLVIACGRMAVTGLALGLLGARSLGPVLRRCTGDARIALRVALAAALLAAHFGTWIASFSLTTVLRSVALVSTQPLFAGLLGRMIGDRAPTRLYVGATLAALGTAVMASSSATGAGGLDARALIGDALALIGAATAAAYLIIGRSVKAELPLRGYLSLVHVGGSTLILIIVLVVGVPFDPPGVRVGDWLAVLYLGLVPGLVGHGLFNWSVRHVPVHTVSLAALLEPVGASILAWLVLGSRVGPIEAAGAAILLLGVLVGLPRRGAGGA